VTGSAESRMGSKSVSAATDAVERRIPSPLVEVIHVELKLSHAQHAKGLEGRAPHFIGQSKSGGS